MLVSDVIGETIPIERRNGRINYGLTSWLGRPSQLVSTRAAVAVWRKRDAHPHPSAWSGSISRLRQLLGPDFVAHDAK